MLHILKKTFSNFKVEEKVYVTNLFYVADAQIFKKIWK